MTVIPYTFNRSGAIRPVCISVVKSYKASGYDACRYCSGDICLRLQLCPGSPLHYFPDDKPRWRYRPEDYMRVGEGMTKTDVVCRTVTGGIPAISVKHGKVRQDDVAAQDRTSALVKEFVAQFRERDGPVMFTGRTWCDPRDPAGLAKAKEFGVCRTKCPKYVRDAVEIAEKIIR